MFEDIYKQRKTDGYTFTATPGEAGAIRELNDTRYRDPVWPDRARAFSAIALWRYLGVEDVTNWVCYGKYYDLLFGHAMLDSPGNWITLSPTDLLNGGENMADKLELEGESRKRFMDYQTHWNFLASLLHAAANHKEII